VSSSAACLLSATWLSTIEPFYHKSSFSWSIIARGTALAALTYIGFDGLTTLSEEVENPRRNILLEKSRPMLKDSLVGCYNKQD